MKKRLIAFTAILLVIFMGVVTTTQAKGQTIDGYHNGRNYYLYVPDGYDQTKTYPLMVVLHGCLQSAEDVRDISGMNDLADQEGFLVLYPRQSLAANTTGCWNWFYTSNQKRGSGEPNIINGMVNIVKNNYNINQDKVYVTGLSAGAAMSVILAATYPDVFSGLGVMAGVQFKAATSVFTSTTVMLYGGLNPVSQGVKAYQAMQASIPKVMPTIIFHGTSDQTIRVVNGRNLLTQWITTNDLADDGKQNNSISTRNQTVTNYQVSGGYKYKVTKVFDQTQTSVVEYYEISSMGHAWSGGKKALALTSFSDPKGPDATRIMWNFFTK